MFRIILFLFLCSVTYGEEFKFAVIADCQYCDQPDKGSRQYKSSLGRLRLCVNELNKHDLKFTVHLGDLIDKSFISFKPVLNVLKKSTADVHHVLGNHDFSVKDELKEKVPTTLNMPAKYYSVKVNNWRFIMLDGNDVSLHAYPKKSEQTKAAEEYYRDNKIKSPKWNGAIGSEQMAWLKALLTGADRSDEKVVLFCHFPVFPQDPHNLWNAEELLTLLAKHKSVKAYINGHNHKGNYGQKDGIHYLTVKGMVQFEKPTFSVVSVSSSELKIKGYGAEKERQLKQR